MLKEVLVITTCMACLLYTGYCASNSRPTTHLIAKGDETFEWPPFQFAKNNLKRLKSRMGFDNFLQGTLTTGLLLDSFNGASFLLAPSVARAAAGGLPPIPSSISHLLGVTFLSAGVGKAAALSDGDLSFQKVLCRNNVIPLSVLGITLIGTPFAPTTTAPAVAFQGIAAPLAATSVLAWANLKASKYEPPIKK